MTAGKKISGRKRHLVVDTLGLVLVALVTAACMSDTEAALDVGSRLRGRIPRLQRIWADQGYKQSMIDWFQHVLQVVVAIVIRRAVPHFEVQPKRWIVERTFARILLANPHRDGLCGEGTCVFAYAHGMDWQAGIDQGGAA